MSLPKGFHHSEATKEKIRQANLGKKMAPRSELWRKKLSEAHKTLWENPEYRKRQTQSHAGKKLPPEQRKKMSESHKGKTRTREHAENLSKALKQYFRAHPERRPFLGKTGEKCPHWKGGKMIRKDGSIFLYCPYDVRADAKGYVKESRLIAEKMLGRPLKRIELVHHINQNPSDNRESNLFVCNNSDHTRLHHQLRRRP